MKNHKNLCNKNCTMRISVVSNISLRFNETIQGMPSYFYFKNKKVTDIKENSVIFFIFLIYNEKVSWKISISILKDNKRKVN